MIVAKSQDIVEGIFMDNLIKFLPIPFHIFLSNQ
jgi:hypothetical protein